MNTTVPPPGARRPKTLRMKGKGDRDQEMGLLGWEKGSRRYQSPKQKLKVLAWLLTNRWRPCGPQLPQLRNKGFGTDDLKRREELKKMNRNTII